VIKAIGGGAQDIMRMLRVQRHDFLNHLQVVMGYVQIGRGERALDYIKDYIAILTKEGFLVNLASPELALHLLLFAQEARDRGILCRLEVPAPLPEGNYDFDPVLDGLLLLRQWIWPVLAEIPAESRCLTIGVTGGQTGPEVSVEWAMLQQEPMNNICHLIKRQTELAAVMEFTGGMARLVLPIPNRGDS